MGGYVAGNTAWGGYVAAHNVARNSAWVDYVGPKCGQEHHMS